MSINSALNKMAWAVRRESAQKFNCPVMQITWKHCLQLAKQLTNRATIVGNAVREYLKCTDLQFNSAEQRKAMHVKLCRVLFKNKRIPDIRFKAYTYSCRAAEKTARLHDPMFWCS